MWDEHEMCNDVCVQFDVKLILGKSGLSKVMIIPYIKDSRLKELEYL